MFAQTLIILFLYISVQFSSVAQLCPTLCDPMNRSTPGWPPCPTPTPRVYSNSCPSSRWCHPAISYSVVPFPSCPQSLPASGLFQWASLMVQLVKNLPAMWETWDWCLGWEDPLEKGKATHSSIQSMESQRVGCDFHFLIYIIQTKTGKELDPLSRISSQNTDL